MIKYVLIGGLFLSAALLTGQTAHAQCSGLSAFTGPGGTFTAGASPNAADLNCLQSTLKETFLPRSGGTVSGVFESVPTGVPAPVGDNRTTLDLKGGRVNIMRQLQKAVTNTPNLVVQLNNASPIPVASYGLYPQLATQMVLTQGLAGGTASLAGGLFSMNLFGDHPYTAQDVAVQSTINQYGTDSAWLFDGFIRDLTGMPPKPFSQVGAEYDMSANGPETPISAYDPNHAYRYFLSLNPDRVEWPGWAANTAYHAAAPNQTGSVIQQKDPAGVLSIYVATTGGKSGAAMPVFPAHGTVRDGSVVWTYQQPAAVEYGRAIWIDNGYGKWPVADPAVRIGTGMGTDALYYNAILDFSEATLAPGTTAAIRLAAGAPIDFSGNGTAAGQNLHVLAYSAAANALTYAVKGIVVLAITDSGLASFPGQVRAPLATPKSSSSPCVAGTRMADRNYEYVCVATNTWKRAALSSF